MKPLHLVDAPIDSPILFGKQHAVEALDNEERLLFDGVEKAFGHGKPGRFGQAQAVVLVLAQLFEPTIRRFHDMRRCGGSLRQKILRKNPRRTVRVQAHLRLSARQRKFGLLLQFGNAIRPLFERAPQLLSLKRRVAIGALFLAVITF